MFTFNFDRTFATQFLAEVFVALVTFLGLLLVGEIALRAFDDFELNSPFRLMRAQELHKSKVSQGPIWQQVQFSNPYNLNAEGFHAPEFGTFPSTEERIAVIGDSFVEALQVQIDANFVALADERIRDATLIPLGRSAMYAPVQLEFFRSKLPELFGAEGRYPKLDAVVFCIRSHGVRLYFAQGIRAWSGGGGPSPSIQYRVKSHVIQAWQLLPQLNRIAFSTSSHALSFISSRAKSWLDADLYSALSPITKSEKERAVESLFTRVIEPMIALARERNLKIGFLYLPTHPEVQTTTIDESTFGDWSSLITQRFSAVDVPFVNALDFIAGEPEVYFQTDQHPNLEGHELLSLAFEDLLVQVRQP